MKYSIIGNNPNPTIAFLTSVLNTGKIEEYYTAPHMGGYSDGYVVGEIYLHPTKKKTPASMIKEYLSEYLPPLMELGVKLLVVNNPDYFKILTKQGKTDITIGDIMPCVVSGLEVTYIPNYSRVFYDPDKIKERIGFAMGAVMDWLGGSHTKVGKGIIHVGEYPNSTDDKIAWLDKLLEMDVDLTIDIEGFDLRHYDAGIGTITFCWNEHEGVAFSVDYEAIEEVNGVHGANYPNPRLRAALRRFFIKYKRKAIYHNICYDVYVLIYQLFMKDILDQEGLLCGLEVMLRNWDCTQILTYLAVNSCAGNELGLKTQAQEFAGNYAVEEIKDITRIPEPELLRYNLIDGLSTWYVYNKHMPTVIADDQMVPYKAIFRPAVVDIIQMQLTGMPINMDKVVALDKQLKAESEAVLKTMNDMPIVKAFVDHLLDAHVIKKNLSYKKKVITKADVAPGVITFNPNSAPQLQQLLYSEDFLGLPVLDYTDSKLPSTGADTLDKLVVHCKDKPGIQKFLQALLEYKSSAIILSTFLPAFLKAKRGPDGWHYLFGNFRLGGTASGRLSSNNPNLQNIPSSGASDLKARLAKLIKGCFEPPPGWLFVGLDFDSLEDKISAVTTRDPEKIKVYSDGYDGHCLRAASYFSVEMPDILIAEPDDVTYQATMDGKTVSFIATETVQYLGQTMTGQELAKLLGVTDEDS